MPSQDKIITLITGGELSIPIPIPRLRIVSHKFPHLTTPSSKRRHRLRTRRPTPRIPNQPRPPRQPLAQQRLRSPAGPEITKPTRHRRPRAYRRRLRRKHP
jgi:hypothetical protein